MAGPKIMSLGPFVFEAIGFGFNGRQSVVDTPWVQTPVAGGPDQLQWLGGRSTTLTISGVLFSEFGGQASLEGIKAAAENGIPLPLVSLGNFPFNVFGLYVVTRVSEDEEFIDDRGRARMNAYDIALHKRPQAVTGGLRGALLSLIF